VNEYPTAMRNLDTLLEGEGSGKIPIRENNQGKRENSSIF